ncbi:glutathione S-transferase T2-like [Apium graveolens]|uniref:glutathione S-transferase T2-like n=1 Tax=Apium graveolens TaxID=4045 RepID=UPI003D7AE7D9
MAMKKRWQRINEGAQKFGSCHDKALRRVGSGSKLDNIIEEANALHLKYYKKKPNFNNHWREFRRQPKWRTPRTSESSKRTKLSSSGTYSSEGNNDTPTSDEFELIHPKGTEAAKRKGKGKATAAEVEEYEAFKANDLRKMTIMETVNEIRQKDIETRRRELEAKQAEMDLQVILADTEKMNDAQWMAHAKLLEKIMARN